MTGTTFKVCAKLTVNRGKSVDWHHPHHSGTPIVNFE